MTSETYDVIKRFCEDKFPDPERAGVYATAMARDELFEKENEFGKSFFDFNADEMESYLLNISTNRIYKGKNKPVSPSYLGQLVAYYREMCFFRMRETGVYKENVLLDKRFNYSLSGRLNNDMPVFTKDTLERCCLAFDDSMEKCEADLSKLLLWLAYSGCYDYRDIMSIREEDIDFDARTIRLGSRTIRMKDECYELLIHHHDIQEYQNYRMTNMMVPYHESYIWVPIRVKMVDMDTMNAVELREKYIAENNARTFQRVTDIFSKKIAYLRNEEGIYVTLELLYMRGIFDYMVDRCGYDRTVEIIRSKGRRGNEDEYKEFISLLSDYGAKCSDKGEIYRAKYSIGTHFIR